MNDYIYAARLYTTNAAKVHDTIDKGDRGPSLAMAYPVTSTYQEVILNVDTICEDPQRADEFFGATVLKREGDSNTFAVVYER